MADDDIAVVAALGIFVGKKRKREYRERQTTVQKKTREEILDTQCCGGRDKNWVNITVLFRNFDVIQTAFVDTFVRRRRIHAV